MVNKGPPCLVLCVRPQAVLDGYSAPLTAGQFARLVAKREYDGVAVKATSQAVLSDARSAAKLAAETPEMPLELKPSGEFQPVYRTPLDVAVLPLPTFSGMLSLPILPMLPTLPGCCPPTPYVHFPTYVPYLAYLPSLHPWACSSSHFSLNPHVSVPYPEPWCLRHNLGTLIPLSPFRQHRK